MHKKISYISDNNPIKTFYLPKLEQAKTEYEILQTKFFEKNNHHLKKIEEKIQDLKNQNKKAKQKLAWKNHIALRKLLNIILVFLSIFIIGFIFAPIYRWNNKTTDAYDEEIKNMEAKLDELIAKEKIKLLKIFSLVSPYDLQTNILKKLGFKVDNKVDNNLLKVVSTRNHFENYIDIKKYTYDNFYFYNAYYTTINWDFIFYKNSKSVVKKFGGVSVATTVGGVRKQASPFVNIIQSIIYPTSYLTDLNFKVNKYVNVWERGIYETSSITKSIYELKSFNNNFKLEFNDKNLVKQFFNKEVQKNFLEFRKFEKKQLNNDVRLIKYQNILYTKRKIDDDTFINDTNWWVQNIISKNWMVSFEEVVKKLRQNIINNIEYILRSLTIIMLNKKALNQAENLDSKDFKTLKNNYVFNSIYLHKMLDFVEQKNDTKIYLKDIKVIKENKLKIFDFNIYGFNKTNKIDYVNQEGTIIDIPYQEFNLSFEKKLIYLIKDIKINNLQILTNKNNEYQNVKQLNKHCNRLINKWNIAINELKIDEKLNLKQLKKAIDFIDYLFNNYPYLNTFANIKIDENGLGLFINKPHELPEDFKKYNINNTSQELIEKWRNMSD
ncbi:hypothetical protein FJO69_00735 [[Mycoplasma] falconis]|uniref:Uncharacterized protein n=1 Tax=[Mycoplasma] falconis TaxID=92403 RepID=A0A501XBA2_9BACT|nr:hypothetical protein [[Mycoplasma] falconis]TPE57709.1 hypothetical protein FJO69_00735 [[Mycoplasma] falconis]